MLDITFGVTYEIAWTKPPTLANLRESCSIRHLSDAAGLRYFVHGCRWGLQTMSSSVRPSKRRSLKNEVRLRIVNKLAGQGMFEAVTEDGILYIQIC